MSLPEKISAYVTDVCGQIRWKRAHGRISEEMANHIIDSRDAYIEQGLNEQSATDKAITDTGDAVSIGAQLDRIHRPKPQWGMLGITAALLMIGLLIRMFIFNDEDRVGLLETRLMWTAVGIAAMFAAYFADFTLLGKFPKAVYFSVIAIFLVIMRVTVTVGGRSYIAHAATLLFPLAFAAVIFAMRNKGYWGIIVCGLAVFPQMLLIYLVPSTMGMLNLVLCGIALLTLAIMKNWFGAKRLNSLLLLFIPVVSVVTYIAVLMIQADTFGRRLAGVFNPYLDPQGSGYFGVMIRELLNGAVWFGQGDIPELYEVGLLEPYMFFYTDLLLTAIIAKLGWFAFALIMCVFSAFIIKGFMLCFKQKSTLGLFISFSVMMLLTLQVIDYTIYNLGFVLATSISLPLVSYGNTATIINLILIGFMLSAFRTGDVATDGKAPVIINRGRFITWEDGKLTINFRKLFKRPTA